MRLKKNDTVAVIAGKDKGKKGKVLRVLPSNGSVIVEGANFAVYYMRPSQENPKGGIQRMEAKLNISNVQLICPKCSKLTRVGYQFLADGTKHRICKKCHEIV